MSIQSRIAELKRKHAALDQKLKKLGKEAAPCSIEVQAIKKQKCAYKTEISRLSGELKSPPKLAAKPVPKMKEEPEPDAAVEQFPDTLDTPAESVAVDTVVAPSTARAA